MVQRELLEYVSSSFKRGFSAEQIRLNLLAQGKSDYDIHEAMKVYESGVEETKLGIKRKDPYSSVRKVLTISIVVLALFILVIYFLFN